MSAEVGAWPLYWPIGWPRAINAAERFSMLWDELNGEREGAAWSDNPWVWAITFKRLEQ